VIDLPGVLIGIAIGATHLGALYPDLVLARTLFDSLTGAVAGAGGLLAIALSYKLVRKIEGMGLGDVKMMAMLGAVLGWQPLLPLLVMASLCGALVGVFVAVKSGKGMQVALPFGVFLGMAFLAVLLFGNELYELWMALLLVPE
jgi:leader peptidase (prepilin peptidase)/N-methyltransferase